MKYIIESNDVIGYTPKYAMLFGDGYMIQPLEDLEVLTSDYINEHYGDLQDTAYQRGLEDAWNVARKIAVETDDGGVSISALYEMFGTESMCMIMKNNTVHDVTNKLKAYEEKQKADDEIKVGDEVRGINGNEKLVITAIESEYDHCVVMTKRGGFFTANLSSLVKTGRHFDISSILKEMRND